MDSGHSQRRLAVVLAAKVVNTMDADEAVTLAALNTHRPGLNDEYQDRIFKLTSDRLLAEFPRFQDRTPRHVGVRDRKHPLENAHSEDIGPEV